MTDVVIPLSKKGTVKVYTQAYVDKQQKQIAELEKKVGRYQTGMFDEIEKRDKKLTEALKHLKDLTYVVELGKNELATARILAEAKQFLSERWKND